MLPTAWVATTVVIRLSSRPARVVVDGHEIGSRERVAAKQDIEVAA
jgi:hypothetical protein